MAKQIIVLDTNPSDGGAFSVRCAFWFPVGAGKEWPMNGVTSVWTAASQAETLAIQLGQVIEETRSYSFPSTTATVTIKANLVASYQSRGAYLATQAPKGQYYGVFYDSSNTWSA